MTGKCCHHDNHRVIAWHGLGSDQILELLSIQPDDGPARGHVVQHLDPLRQWHSGLITNHTVDSFPYQTTNGTLSRHPWKPWPGTNRNKNTSTFAFNRFLTVITSFFLTAPSPMTTSTLNTITNSGNNLQEVSMIDTLTELNASCRPDQNKRRCEQLEISVRSLDLFSFCEKWLAHFLEQLEPSLVTPRLAELSERS